MNSHTGRNGEFQGMGWVGDSAVLLLLIGTGLVVFVQQTLEHVSLATTLLALYLSSWAYVLGLLGLLFLSVRWLVSWQRVRATRAAMSRYSPAPQFPLQQGVAPVVPNRTSVEGDERNSTTMPSRVA
jgi:hypothetical protein